MLDTRYSILDTRYSMLDTRRMVSDEILRCAQNDKGSMFDARTEFSMWLNS
ncbi:MAG: hypothetical protein IIB56_02480 [Planctomycetes bacterium]|nr:hypothetical protein [Planctomycetota bacterium]